MSNREHFCESSFYPVRSEQHGILSGPGSFDVHQHQHNQMVAGPTGGSLWKLPQYVPAPVAVVEQNTKVQADSEAQHHNAQTPQTQSDFPLLYHLLLLRNFYQNSQQLYSMRSPDLTVDQSQPLDLSCRGTEGYLSAFTKERTKISCDESINDNEEVEVVYKEDKSKSESVKEFVERKIKEYKRAEENFESFVNKPNLKENDIKRKMNKIKTKYTKINKKLKKLDELKPKLEGDKTNDDSDCDDSVVDMAIELRLSGECYDHNKEPNNNNPSEETRSPHSSPDCEEEQEVVQKEQEQEVLQEEVEQKGDQEDNRFQLKPEGVIDGSRVLLRLETVLYPGRVTNILPPDIYGVIVDKERGNKPHVFSLEDLLSRVTREVRPSSKSQLTLGSRVGVFWSSKMNFLHPAVVTSLEDTEENYVVVTTDDGDTRELHIDQVRLLSQDFSTLAPDSRESFSFPDFKILSSARTVKSRRAPRTEKMTEKMTEKKADLKEGKWSWADEGVLTSPRSKVLHHRKICDSAGSLLEVGDHAVFLSKTWSKLPYLGKIVDMWATLGGKMKVKTNWLYHQAEVDGLAVGGGRVVDVEVAGAVFESSHFDDNNVQSISHKCDVIRYNKKTEQEKKHYDYCAVGHFDPVEGCVMFYDGVLHL